MPTVYNGRFTVESRLLLQVAIRCSHVKGNIMATQDQLSILYALYKELARLRYGDEKKWSKISLGHKVTSYFSGGSGSVAGFANKLNQIDPMNADGILIHPADLHNAKTIGNIFAAIIKAYEDAGWEVTP